MFRPFLFLFAMGALLPAEDTAPSHFPIDRAAAVAQAIAHHPDLQAARLSIEAARARAGDAGRPANPTLAVGAVSDLIDRRDGLGSWSVEWEQRFPVTGRLRHERRIAAAEIALAEAELREAARGVAYEVEQVFDTVQTIDAELAVLSAQITLDEALRQVLVERVERAEASPVDVRQLSTRIGSLRQQVRSDERRRLAELDRLAWLLGLPPGERPAIAPTPLEATLPAFTAAMLAAHPAVSLRDRLVELAAGTRDLARAARWDDIAVALALSGESSIDEPFGREREHFLGVTVTVPLPLFQRQEGATRAAALRHEQRERERDAMVRRLQHEAASRRAQFLSLQAQLVSFREELLPATDAILREMEQAYANGQIDLTALFETRRAHLEQRGALLSLEAEARTLATAWRHTTAANLPLSPLPSDPL